MSKLSLGTYGPIIVPWQATSRSQMTSTHIEMQSCLHAKGEPAASALQLLHSFISCPPLIMPQLPPFLLHHTSPPFLGGPWDQPYRQSCCTLCITPHREQQNRDGHATDRLLMSLSGQLAHNTSLISSLCQPQCLCNLVFSLMPRAMYQTIQARAHGNSPKLIICP